jgi:hypothetical protein
MAKLTPQQFAEKWQRRLQSAAPDITNGINRVDSAPTEKAALKKDKMLANVTLSINNGKWEAGLHRVTLADWKKAAIEKGVPRIAQGATGATPKVTNFASQLLPFQDTLQAQVKALPDLTLEDSINRMNVWVRGMAKFSRT